MGNYISSYNTFFNKISGSSLNQWLPEKLDLCRELILNSVSDGAIKEIELEDGQVIDQQWILHHFEFDSFCVFGFLDNFALPTARPGNPATRRHGFLKTYSGHSILDIDVVIMASKRKWCTYQLALLDPSSSQSFARTTMAYST